MVTEKLVINKFDDMVTVQRKESAPDNCWLFFAEVKAAVKAAGYPVTGWRQSKTTDTWILDLVERPKYHPLTA